MKNWKEKGGKSQVPSFTALCINYWTTPLYTHPTWSPSLEWSQKHKLVYFQNLSKSCLFQHLLKDDTECPAVITKASGIYIIILITGAWLKHRFLNHKRPRPQLDHGLLYSLMLHSAACMKNWEKHQANIQNANCGMCKELVPTGCAHGLVMLFLEEAWALFNPSFWYVWKYAHSPRIPLLSECKHLFEKQLGSVWSPRRAGLSWQQRPQWGFDAHVTTLMHNFTAVLLSLNSPWVRNGFEAALCLHTARNNMSY